MRADEGHIALDVLWRFRHEKAPLDSDDLKHIYDCDHCLEPLFHCLHRGVLLFVGIFDQVGFAAYRQSEEPGCPVQQPFRYWPSIVKQNQKISRLNPDMWMNQFRMGPKNG